MSYRNILMVGLIFSFFIHLFFLKLITFTLSPTPQKDTPTIVFLGSILQRQDITRGQELFLIEKIRSYNYEPNISPIDKNSRFYDTDSNDKTKTSQSIDSNPPTISKSSIMKFISELPKTEDKKTDSSPEAASLEYKPLKLEINDKN